MPESNVFNIDCLEGMHAFPDKFFDLAVVDPPYGDGRSQSGNVERESNTVTHTQQTDGEKASVHRTGGGWAAKLDPGKKSERGTLRRGRNILRSCSASHATRSSGAAIISPFLLQGAFWCGANRRYRLKAFPWPLWGTPGRALTKTLQCLKHFRVATNQDSIRHKSPCPYTPGY